MMDMVAALQWVKKTSPSSAAIRQRNHLRRVGRIVRSQYAHGRTVRARPLRQSHRRERRSPDHRRLEMETLARPRSQRAGVDEDHGAKSLVELRAISTDKILEFAGKRGMVGFAPVLDGKFLTEPVVDTYKAGKQAKVRCWPVSIATKASSFPTA